MGRTAACDVTFSPDMSSNTRNKQKQSLTRNTGKSMINTMQQISLKLLLGIDPATSINAKILREMWVEKSAGKYGPARMAGARLCARAQASSVMSHSK
jgi:hypothetical protein